MHRYLVFVYFLHPPHVLLFVRANNADTARSKAKRHSERAFHDIPVRTKTIGIDTTLLYAEEIEHIATFN